MDKEAYLECAAATRRERLAWFQEARFGMFVHWGLYSQLGRHEWAMERECIPIPEYEKLADTWHPKPRPMREWARLAKKAGMHYMVLTTKHCEGYCLWDTQQTDYNSVKRGPRRDLVREYVDACREYGLKIGFYYVLMDWHHPDARRCHRDEGARRRYIDFVRAGVHELMSNYGKIDILWWDSSWPLTNAEQWESPQTNAMVRSLQPDIIINNRSALEEDYDTPEGHVTPAAPERYWEACMTSNGSWGYMPSASNWVSPRDVVEMLRTAAAGRGNLLLNVGPAPDGSLPPQAEPLLKAVGRWIERNAEAVYGQTERTDRRLDWMPIGNWTIKGNNAYFWCSNWPGSELVIGALATPVRSVTLLSTGSNVAFEQVGRRLFLQDLPVESPDEIAGVAVIRLEFDSPPRQDRSNFWSEDLTTAP